MRIAFRVDASVRMGIGHLRRCLSLGEALAEGGGRITFVTRDLGLDSAERVREAGLAALALAVPEGNYQPRLGEPAHAGWAGVGWQDDADEMLAALAGEPLAAIVVDHYAFDARWHDRVRAATGARIVAIDDLGDRPLAADIVVDPTLADHQAKHRLSASFRPLVLGGPDHALLSGIYRRRPKFVVRERVASVGVFMGGSDVDNATATALKAVRRALGNEVAVEIVTTGANPHIGALQQLIGEDSGASLRIDLPDLAAFFATHDLQIGAGGGATWERCCIGAPTVLVAFADNQLPVARPLDAQGILCFSENGATDAEALAADIAELAADQGRRGIMSRRARALVDGLGVERVRRTLNELAQD